MKWILILVVVHFAQCNPNPFKNDDPHDFSELKQNPGEDWSTKSIPTQERTTTFWQNQAQNLLRNKVNQRLNTNRARNVVVLIGDGMGLSTQMATRVYMNDLNTELSFERFPYAGLSKTYCIDRQVPDSACTATALFSGIKTSFEVLNLNGNVQRSNCASQQNTANHVDSIFKHAQDAGRSTGIVTNTRVTHATPAAIYAKSAHRTWEGNNDTPSGCPDIATQLITGDVGSKLDVILGGGSRYFRPNTFVDRNGNRGWRTDSKDLVQEYTRLNNLHNRRGVFVETRTDLNRVNPATTDRLFGLFGDSHLSYRISGTTTDEPSILDMTRQALNILRKNNNGYFLMVEGGRIDHGHHGNHARKALDETVAFDETVQFVLSQVNLDDTLVLVTADHSHVFTVGGYPERGNNILSHPNFTPDDGMNYFTLGYANGPSFLNFILQGGRRNPQGMNFMDPTFEFPSTVPRYMETHGGEDVGVYAIGPHAHLFTGVYEQNYIAHVLMYSSCVGPRTLLRGPHCP